MPLEVPAPRPERPSGVLATCSLLLVLAGVLGYFVVVFKLAAWLPSIRNQAMPNWLLVIAGLALALLAIRRAPAARLPQVLLVVNVALAAIFAGTLYVMPVVPAASGPVLGTLAPDFVLPDESGKPVQLSALRGTPVLLVFYRGHW